METVQFADIESLLRHPPPREVPSALIKATYKALVTRSGRKVLKWFPILMAGFLAFMFLLSIQTERLIAQMRFRFEPKAVVEGVVTKIKIASQRKRNLYRNDFEFHLPPSSGLASPVVGWSFTDLAAYTVGQKVRIEYLPAAPGTARIKGARFSAASLRSMLGTFVLLTLNVPVYFFVCWYSMPNRYRRLFRTGIMIKGKILEIRPLSYHRRQVRFVFDWGGKTQTATFDVVPNTQAWQGLIERQQGEDDFMLFVNPAKPKEIFPLAALAGEG